jgi:hypothetical protein
MPVAALRDCFTCETEHVKICLHRQWKRNFSAMSLLLDPHGVPFLLVCSMQRERQQEDCARQLMTTGTMAVTGGTASQL